MSFSFVSVIVFSNSLISSLINSLISLSRSVASLLPSLPAFSNRLAFSSSASLVLSRRSYTFSSSVLTSCILVSCSVTTLLASSEISFGVFGLTSSAGFVSSSVCLVSPGFFSLGFASPGFGSIGFSGSPRTLLVRFAILFPKFPIDVSNLLNNGLINDIALARPNNPIAKFHSFASSPFFSPFPAPNPSPSSFFSMLSSFCSNILQNSICSFWYSFSFSCCRNCNAPAFLDCFAIEPCTFNRPCIVPCRDLKVLLAMIVSLACFPAFIALPILPPADCATCPKVLNVDPSLLIRFSSCFFFLSFRSFP